MNIRDLVGKRCLLKLQNRYNSIDLTEYRILESSPSGNFVKLLNLNGNKFWKAIGDVSFVEELRDLKAEREQHA